MNNSVTLGELPKEVLAEWAGMHMLENHAEGMQLASNE